MMLDLAQQDPKAYTSVASIAQRQEISVKYLEMIISILNKGGYLRSQMGKKVVINWLGVHRIIRSERF